MAGLYPAQYSYNAGPYNQRRTSRNSRSTSRLLKNQRNFPVQTRDALNLELYVQAFEAARGFDAEDDEIFCPPHLLTEEDLQSITSAGSDRSSQSSTSPTLSPAQAPRRTTSPPMMDISAGSAAFFAPTALQGRFNTLPKQFQPSFQASQQMKIRNAIPIVDPSTRSITAPAPSVSPSRQMMQQPQQFLQRRF